MQIETRVLNFKESAQSKVGSMDYVDHKAGGGDKKVKYRLVRLAINFRFRSLVFVAYFDLTASWVGSERKFCYSLLL